MLKRSIAAAILAAAAFPALAVDSLHKITVTDADRPVLEITSNYVGMSDADYTRLMAQGEKFFKRLSAGGKFKDDGTFKVVFSEASTRDGKVTPGGEVVFEGLSLKELNRVMRAVQVYTSDVIDGAEAHARKGKKKPWGN